MRATRNTKQKILDAAERLFAERGFDATSLRAITASAGVNLAAVNYHFRSKDELIRAVLARNLAPLNARRLELLAGFEARAQGQPVPAEQIVRALIGPMLELQRLPGHANLPMLVGRMYTDPSPRIRQLFVDELGETARRFRKALQRSLPDLPPTDLYWRIGFMIGATAITMAASWIIQMMSRGLCDPSDVEGTLERLVGFVVAGLQSPLPAGNRRMQRQSHHSTQKARATAAREGL